MKARMRVFAAPLLAALALPAGAADPHSGHAGPARPPAAWSSAPMLVPAGPMARGKARLQPRNISVPALEVRGPGGGSRSFPVGAEGAELAPVDPKLGNYHWVTAREILPGEERTAATAWYVSNPGPAPTWLPAALPLGLSILPRLPREHASYREGEQWDFKVLFDGRPVAGAVVKLETEFGTRTQASADQQGRARLVFPRDFDPARLQGSGHGRRAGAAFVVSAEVERDGVRHFSAFNATYSPDPWRSRDLLAGAGFLLLGMAAAAPLLRRKEEKK